MSDAWHNTCSHVRLLSAQENRPFCAFHAAKVTKNNYIAKLFGGNLNDSYSYFSTTLFGNSEKNA